MGTGHSGRPSSDARTNASGGPNDGCAAKEVAAVSQGCKLDGLGDGLVLALCKGRGGGGCEAEEGGGGDGGETHFDGWYEGGLEV